MLYSPEGNRLRRYDLDTVKCPPLVQDVLIESAASPGGRDINGQVCALPDGSGFIAGEDTGQPNPPAGWGVFSLEGEQIGKLTATPIVEVPDPFGCAFDEEGRLFTTEMGNQLPGEGQGQLIMWFPPFDPFPGPPGAYPNTNEVSSNFCKIATDLSTASSVAIDDEGCVYVAEASGISFIEPGQVRRFSPPFPTSPDAAGGCGSTDETGAPMADEVRQEVFINDPRNLWTPTGIARAPNGNWYVSSVFTGIIAEYDPKGDFVRRIVQPRSGWELLNLPVSVGHPQSLAVDSKGNIYYTDMQLTVRGGGIGPGPNGKIRWVGFSDDVPQPPVIVREGLAFPDGLGILPGW